MLGFISRRQVQRAVQLAREDSYRSNVNNYRADQAELVSFVKAEAQRASRPSKQQGRDQRSETPVPSA